MRLFSIVALVYGWGFVRKKFEWRKCGFCWGVLAEWRCKTWCFDGQFVVVCVVNVVLCVVVFWSGKM
jgi:hypothetical protein